MSVDPSTLTETIVIPPIKSWQIKWNNTIIPNITSSTELEEQCINTKCTIETFNCECIKRIIFIMHFYSIWININSNNNNTNNIPINNNPETNNYLSISLCSFIFNLKHYSIISLTNDWLHLREHHWTDINIQYQLRKLFQSIIGNCNQLEKCSIFARVNRDRNKFKNNSIRKHLYFINNTNKNESIEITTQQLCDSIHDCIFHAPIICLPKIPLNIPTENNNENDNELYDDEWDLDASTEASMLRLLSPTLKEGFSARKTAISNLKNTNSKYFQHSKFVTSIGNMDVEPVHSPMDHLDILDKLNGAITDNEDNKDDEKYIISSQPKLSKLGSMSSYNFGSYEFGIEMMYSQHYQKHARFSTMKDEVLKNENKKYNISINQWNDTIKKAQQQWMQCIRGKTLKATNCDSEMHININDALNVQSLVSCLLYTNFTDLQRKFSGSTRRYNSQLMETDNDIKIKHYRDYFHWGKTLMICIYCYGDLMNEKLSFYHGINSELVFGEFTAYFNCPTSTTISLSIASSFASKDGIILKLSGRAVVNIKTKFMDVSWFSDYPNEEERLFYGQHNELEIRSIYRGNRDYKNFVRAIKVLDMFTDPIIRAGRRYTKINESKYYNHLVSMIKNFIDKPKYKQEINQQKSDKELKKKHWKTKEIPSDYMQNIFNHFCRMQTTISIDWKKLSPLCTDKKHELVKYFLIRQHAASEQFVYCINIPLLIQLFPKVKFITLDFGGNKQLKIDQFEYVCKNIKHFLNEIKNKIKIKKYHIETVTLSGLLNPYQHKYIEKEDIKRIKKKYLSNTTCKVALDKKSVQFTLFSKKKIPNYENVFVGNLHSIGSPKSLSPQKKHESKSKKKVLKTNMDLKKKKDMHIWTMFISSSKEKLVLPKTIKKVIYNLDKKIFKKNCEEIVEKAPFLLKKKGNKIFKVNVKIIFRGKRKDLNLVHLLNFDHKVTITIANQISDRRSRIEPVIHSNNYHAFNYYYTHSRHNLSKSMGMLIVD